MALTKSFTRSVNLAPIQNAANFAKKAFIQMEAGLSTVSNGNITVSMVLSKNDQPTQNSVKIASKASRQTAPGSSMDTNGTMTAKKYL